MLLEDMKNNLSKPPKQQSQDWWAKEFMDAAMECGCEFLVCGGATARLEKQLVEAGNQLGLDTQVQATPTGLIISCKGPDMSSPRTEIRRIEGSAMNMTRLRYCDRLLSRMAEGQLLPFQALYRLRSKRFKTTHSLWLDSLGLFTIGFGAALLRFGHIGWALAGGLVTVLIESMADRVRQSQQLSGFFVDFLSCLLALLIGAGTEKFFAVPASAVALGTIIHLVPGLLLTTAISELVEQNFLTGTIKLIKATLTLLAMGLAYLLVQDLSKLFELHLPVSTSTAGQITSPNLLLGLAAISLVVWGFSVKIKVPPQFISWSIFCGAAGWLTFYFSSSPSIIVLASFLSSFVVGFLSFRISRHYEVPSQLFSVPGILALAPGLLALSSFYRDPAESVTFTSNWFLQALLVALAIVFGLIAGRVRGT